LLNLALQVRIKPRAQRQIEAAASWWAENRPAVPGAVMADLRGALELLVLEPGIGSKVETPRSEVVRRSTLEVIAFWHERRGSAPSV